MIVQIDNSQQQNGRANKFQINATVIIAVIQIIIHALLWSLITEETPFSCILFYAGAKYTPAIKYHYHFHRLITPIFLHGDTRHLFSNLFGEAILCYPYEMQHGTKDFLLLYFISGISGNVASALYFSQSFGVGASGAIFGFLGYQLAYLIKTNQPQQRFYGILFVLCEQITLIIENNSNIDYIAHFGGMLAGFLWYQKEKRIITCLICFGIICILLKDASDIQYC